MIIAQSKKIKKTPIVSVLMSVYKEPIEWIEESINSILNQSFSDFEFIIVNDNPTSAELRKFLNEFKNKDSRIKVITNSENLGLTKSLNIGLKHCNGEYIARMDADDISHPKRFEYQYEYLESHPDVIVCGSDVKFIGNKSIFLYSCLFENDIDIRGQMLTNSGFAHPSVFIRRSILSLNNIHYDENFKSAQDYRLWEQLCSYGKFHNINKKLLKYRISDSQISNLNLVAQTKNREQIKANFYGRLESQNLLISHDIITKSKEKILSSYLLRSQIYNSFSICLILKFILSNKTKCSIKEIIFLISYAIYKKIKGNK